MKRLLAIIVLVVIVLAGVSFSVLNADSVQLNYYFGTSEPPLAIVVLISVIAGAVFGSLANLAYVLGQKNTNHKLRRKIGLLEKEIKNLREIPIRDRH